MIHLRFRDTFTLRCTAACSSYVYKVMMSHNILWKFVKVKGGLLLYPDRLKNLTRKYVATPTVLSFSG